MADWVLSILMLAGFGLLLGGIYILRSGRNRRQGILMLVAAAVMFLNVGIWTIPTASSPAMTDELPTDATQ